MIIKFPTFGKNSIAQDAVNCWLRYALSQPVELDLGMVVVFVLRFLGIPQWRAAAVRLIGLSGYYRLTLASLTRPDALGKIELPEFTLAENHFPYPSAR